MKRFLIVTDMQKDFVDGALGSEEAVSIVPAVCEKIENFDGEIIATLDTHTEEYMSTREGRFLPVPHCIKGTPGWQLDRDVEKALSKREHTLLEKETFGSVKLPDLIEAMAGGDDFEVHVIGLCTDICVVSNAMLVKARFPEADVYVDAKCCAGVSPATHNAALDTMKCCQMIIENR